MFMNNNRTIRSPLQAMQTLKHAAEESCEQQYSLPVFLSFFAGKVKVIGFRASYQKEGGGEEVQYCGDGAEKSCINLMFGSTGGWEAPIGCCCCAVRLVLAPFQPADKIINSSLLAALHNCG